MGDLVATAPGSTQLLFTPEQAAAQLEVSRSWIYALLASGELKSVRLGRLRRIPGEALQDYVRSLTEQSGGDAA